MSEIDPYHLDTPDSASVDEQYPVTGLPELEEFIIKSLADALEDASIKEELRRQAEEQRSAEKALRLEAVEANKFDERVDLLNRPAFLKAVTSRVEHSSRKGEESREDFAAMIDLDHFGEVNKKYGTLVGDAVLCEVASNMRAGIRSNIDLAGRWGGEEFVLYLNDIALKDALVLVERLRVAISEIRFREIAEEHSIRDLDEELLERQITTSIGLARIPLKGVSIEGAFNLADMALSHAKNNGRNNTGYLNYDQELCLVTPYTPPDHEARDELLIANLVGHA